ncbi:MAG: hypothetical protein IKA70_00385 [Alistipes sp.]|nr:hypothetical protein [Alistipes sp.]
MKQMPYRLEEGALERAKMRSRAAVYAASQRKTTMSPLRWVSAFAAVVCLVLVAFAGYDKWFAPTPMERLIAEMRKAPIEIVYDMTLDSSIYIEEGDSMSDMF